MHSLESRSGDNHLPIIAPHRNGLRNPKLGKSLVAGSVALIHGKQSLAVSKKHICGVSQRLRIHLGLLVSCSGFEYQSLSAQRHLCSEIY